MAKQTAGQRNFQVALTDQFRYCLLYTSEVFTSDNVARLRFFTYSFAALYGLMTLHDWLNHLEAVKQVALLGLSLIHI